jgi:hypothetical protein
VDFGIAVRNLTGFFYGSESPDTITSAAVADTIRDSIRVVRTSRSYSSGYSNRTGVLAGKYAVLAIGLNYRYHRPVSSVAFSVPLDLEVYGLFDGAMKNRVAIRSGIQVHFGDNYFARAGYAWAPNRIPADFRRIGFFNTISLGASILPPSIPAVIDCFFSNYNWGMNTTIEF